MRAWFAVVNVTETPDGDPTTINPDRVVSFSDGDTGGVGGGPGGQQAGPDLAAAAAKLGITQDALKAALGDPGQGEPDFAAAATKLGITEDALKAALGVTEH
jgi:hypothetical protein